MANTIVRGNTITLDSYYLDSTGVQVMPTNPRVSIVDPYGVTVVALATPTAATVGHYTYDYDVPASALLGGYTVIWYGTVDSLPLEDEDVFTVLPADTVPSSPPVDTGPSGGPCSVYCVPADLYACDGCSLFTDDADLLDANIVNATNILWRLTGRQFTGQCTTTIRPCCVDDCGTVDGATWDGWGYPYVPYLAAGEWFNLGPSGGRCQVYECGQAVPRIDTYFYPVASATVKIDGATLAPSAYRVDDWRYLTRTDGDVWPSSNDLVLADSEPGTWSVTLLHGQAPPADLVHATAELACELTKHCKGDQKCALPLRVTAVNRQGVSYNLANVMDVIDRGATGLYYVDLVIRSLNPERLASSPRVVSPDRRPHPRVGNA